MLIKAVAIQYPALGVCIRKDKGRNDGGGEGFLEEVGLESNIREREDSGYKEAVPLTGTPQTQSRKGLFCVRKSFISPLH